MKNIRIRLTGVFHCICYFHISMLADILEFPGFTRLFPFTHMRIISIDYGKKRTGIAVTDPSQIIANGLTTVDTKQLIPFLKDYIQKEQVEKFVIGLPTQLNGLPSDNQQRVRSFAQRLEKEIPQIPYEFYDERFTSVLAHQTILESGIGKKRRQNDKGLVDEISACIILQEYLERQKIY